MSTTEEKHDWIKETMSSIVDKAKKYCKKIILGVAILLVVLVILKIGILFGLYFFFANLITEMTGLDHSYVRSLSILFVVGTLMALPTLLGLFTFKKSKKYVAIAVAVFTVLTMGVVKFKSSHIFFDRETGKPISYYIETPKGYNFSMDENYDPTYGTKYLPVTKEVVAKYLSGELSKSLSDSEVNNQKDEKAAFYEKQMKRIESVIIIADLLTYPTPDSSYELYNDYYMRRLNYLCDRFGTHCQFQTSNDGKFTVSHRADYEQYSVPFILKDPKRKVEINVKELDDRKRSQAVQK